MSSRFIDSAAFKVARQVPNTEIAHRFPKAMVKLLKMRLNCFTNPANPQKGLFSCKDNLAGKRHLTSPSYLLQIQINDSKL